MVLTKIPGELIADNTITTADLVDNAVTTAKIANTNVTAAKLTSGAAESGATGIKSDIALLAFKTQANGNLAKYNLVDQAVDSFEDASGVNASASTNEVRNASGKYYSGAGNVTATGGTITTDGDYTVHKFTSSGTFTTDTAQDVEYLVVGGGGSGGGGGFDGGAGAGNTPSATPSQGNSGGSSGAGGASAGGGGAGAVGESVTTTPGNSGAGGAGTANDIVLTGTNVTYAGGGGGGKSSDYGGAAGAGGAGGGGAGAYGNANGTPGTANTGGGGGGASNPGPNNVGGNGGSGIVVIRRPTTGGIANLTLVSNSTTAEAVPTKADIVLTYTNGAGTATINTDLIASVSRDNGTTYTTTTLASQGTTGGETILSASNVDISGQPSGSSMVWKVVTANQSATKDTRIHGVSLGWA